MASLKGATRAPTSFDDGTFDEAASLAALARRRFGVGLTLYYAMKQQVAFLHGLHDEVLEYAARAAETLRGAKAQPIVTTHCFYHALAWAALYPKAPAGEQPELLRALEQEREKLERWASNCPANFANRDALVVAEIARIEGRDLDAMRLYEEAIRSARENGFVHNEALAHELAGSVLPGARAST